MSWLILLGTVPLVEGLNAEISTLSKIPPSTEEAKKIRAFAGSHEEIILRTLREWFPMTVGQLAERSPLSEDQISRRIAGLVNAGKIVQSGTFPSMVGKSEKVWRASK